MKIVFKNGLLGLEEYKNYELQDIEGMEPYKLLQSTDNKDLGLVVISPFEFCTDYEVNLAEEQIKELEAESENEIALYTTVNINSDVRKMTTNLRAPIVLNIKKKIGQQIILENEVYKIKHPIIKG
ncbi:flagellar assembly protein FliW [Clostridium sp. HBUAS56017]|uniref:flagellar assembly protein FliW n=1 Tax=Clostridium sp. HBUAS56017 TaxID=2571128 RepID=UPI001177BE78|nr:flagellar assembly protein FliW [Clostridium sp. HBUAS56017]